MLVSSSITLRQKGDFAHTRQFLRRCNQPIDLRKLEKYGERGVLELKARTPVDTGLTRDSWNYHIDYGRYGAHLSWYNDNYAGNGERYTVPVAVLIDNGHATKDGRWAPGLHYIEEALGPVIDDLINDMWKELTK